MSFNTDLLHAGVVREANGATLPPVYQSSAFEQDTAADLEKIFENKAPGYCYTRVGNPTVTAFENRITKLEGGMASIACASGMAAIMNAILNIVRSGDEIVSSASLYGGSIDLFRDIEEFGIKTRYVKNNDLEAIEGAINEHTRLLFAETIGNPCLDVTDVERLAEIAHAHKIPLILDNTTATAYLFQGLKHGADIVVNSSSKYINGSSNSISGILTYSGRFQWDPEMYPQIAAYKKFGPMAYIARLRNSLFRDTGACLAPMNAYLNLIGMETLGLRMERQCSNALELAQWLEETYPSVTVNYPGLKSSNWYEISEKQFSRGYGAILTLRVGSKENAFALIDALKMVDGKVELDAEKCNHCGRCVKSCPVDAWEGTPGYIVSFGGTFGNNIYKGEELLPLIPDKETLFRVTDAAITFFEKNANPSERFRKTLQRVGEEDFRKQLKEAYEGQ